MGVDADAVDYNAHHWRVHLRGLEPATPLGAALGMEEAAVVVELSFREELYPFFPPTVMLKSPRMQVRRRIGRWGSYRVACVRVCVCVCDVSNGLIRGE